MFTSKQLDSSPSHLLVLLSLVVGSFMVAVDTSIISVALPMISDDFHSLQDVGSYGSAYLAPLTALQPAMGIVYKTSDSKKVYIGSILLFEVGSIICASANHSYVFIIGRTVAGLGAAGVLQGALAIITHLIPLAKRQIYIGIVVSVFGFSACGGPILGGVLSDRCGWRWCFWINPPLGGAAFLLAMMFMKVDMKGAATQKGTFVSKLYTFDPAGILLLVGAVYALLAALQDGGNRYSWSSSRLVGLLTCSGLLFLMFAAVQYFMGDGATVPPRLLKNRTVITGSLILAFSNAASFIKLYYLPFYFQAVQSSSALRSGVQFLSLALPQMVSSMICSGIITWTGQYAPALVLGHTVAAIGTGLLTTLNISTPTRFWALFMVLSGIGTGTVENTPYIAIQAALNSESEVFIGNGIATFIALLGGCIAIPIGSAILDTVLSESIRQTLPSLQPATVLGAGALGLHSLTSDVTTLHILKGIYARAVDRVMLFALVVTCLGFLATFGIHWKNLKTINPDKGSAGLDESLAQISASENCSRKSLSLPNKQVCNENHVKKEEKQ